jgi:hypothetical protein
MLEQNKATEKELEMTRGAVAMLRKRWASLVALAEAIDYSVADYTNDRIGRLRAAQTGRHF